MGFETVERCGRIHIVRNGVESRAYVEQGTDNEWVILMPRYVRTTSTLNAALRIITLALGNWYTVTEAADRLAELGKTAKPPHPKTVCRWAREGRFPGAIKVGRGQGGSWRLSETALVKFKGGERK